MGGGGGGAFIYMAFRWKADYVQTLNAGWVIL